MELEATVFSHMSFRYSEYTPGLRFWNFPTKACFMMSTTISVPRTMAHCPASW